MATKKLESYPSMINTLVFEKRGGETSDSKKRRIRENLVLLARSDEGQVGEERERERER